MRYKALVSFSCVSLSMAVGDVREISDSSIANDLLKAGYVIPLESKDEKKVKETTEPEESKEEIKAEKPKTKRKGKKSDGN